MIIRLALQSVEKAALLVDNKKRYVDIGKGVVVYLSFLQGTAATNTAASQEEHQKEQLADDAKQNLRDEELSATVRAAVETLINAKIYNFASFPLRGDEQQEEEEEQEQTGGGTGSTANSKPVSLLDAPHVDILVIPQASMAGRIKGKNVQYHAQQQKDEGNKTYKMFCGELRKRLVVAPFLAESASSGGGGGAKSPKSRNNSNKTTQPSQETTEKLHNFAFDDNGLPCKHDDDDEGEDTESLLKEQAQQMLCSSVVAASSSTEFPRRRLVLCGTYGNRQALDVRSCGPNTHFFEFGL